MRRGVEVLGSARYPALLPAVRAHRQAVARRPDRADAGWWGDLPAVCWPTTPAGPIRAGRPQVTGRVALMRCQGHARDRPHRGARASTGIQLRVVAPACMSGADHDGGRAAAVLGPDRQRQPERLCVPRTPSPSLSSTFPEGDLDITVPTRARMITCCGSGTRLPVARSRAELASAARPLRRRQGRRDPVASARDRGTASHEHPAETDLARPRRAQRTEQTAAHRAAPGAAGVAPNPASWA